MTEMTDIAIAQAHAIVPIEQVAATVGIPNEALEIYGKYKAKVLIDAVPNNDGEGKLILVTAMSPTPSGEGKTTMTIGLGDAFTLLQEKVMLALREPSMGPVFGMKGGATGGGYAQAVPMEDINLHFTGDFHAIGAANNLLAAMLDNHIFQGNSLNIDPASITWSRVMDVNDRQLRAITSGQGSKYDGVSRADSFSITVASEVMAIVCLASDQADLVRRLAAIVVGFSTAGTPITAGMLKADGAMAVILKDALKPNLVQTLAQTPVLLHGGPFANIAHGCNSVIATKFGLQHFDYTITEAGFGADLGAEKFLDIKSRVANIWPDAVVLVATLQALKYHGDVEQSDVKLPNTDALRKGYANLQKHIQTMQETYKLPVVVAINRFPTDTDAELALLEELLAADLVGASVVTAWADGGAGAVDLANKVIDLCARTTVDRAPSYAYALEDTVEQKITHVAQKVYGAKDIDISPDALAQITQLETLGYGNLPVCIAKTQYSLSDVVKNRGLPEPFTLRVREMKLAAGAGFIVVKTGKILTMPGLPAKPAAEEIKLLHDGTIKGIF